MGIKKSAKSSAVIGKITGADVRNYVRNTGNTQTAANLSTNSWIQYRLDGNILRLSFHLYFITGAFGADGSPILVKLPLGKTYDTTYYPNGTANTFAAAARLGVGDYWDGSAYASPGIRWYPDLGAIAGNQHVRAVNNGGSSMVDSLLTAGRMLIAFDLVIPVV